MDMATKRIGVLCLSPSNANPMLQNRPTSLTTTTTTTTKTKTTCQCNASQHDITLKHIHTSGIIACLRAPSAELALGAARAALDGGIKVLEVVMSTPGVMEVLNQLVKEYPTITLGVGTILKAEEAKEAIKVGAKFLMSPVIIMDILSDAEESEVLYIPGVMTPTEMLTAYNAGAKIVKVPLSCSCQCIKLFALHFAIQGGIEYVAAVKKPFRHIPMVASQGINIGQVREYIKRGASSVVLSDAIFDKEAVAQGDFDCISQRAQLAASTGNEAVQHLKMVKG